MFAVQRAGQRACFDHGWLKSCHSFSFADYFDPQNINWGALRVLNDDVVEPGQGFPTHPHQDMEIVTYVLEGRLEHRDSTGSHGVVGPGGAQFMSAGTGIRHSEFNHSKSEPLHFLQMWVLPGRRGTKPSYGQVEFDEAARTNKWLAVASGRESVPSEVRLTQDAAMLVSRLEGDSTLRHTFEPGRLGFVFVAQGAIDVETFQGGGSAITESLATGDALRLGDIEKLSLRGNGIIVLWDVPPVSDAPADA
jgi:redox-sensitive bicupin YhaK (pirin superfamily)